ncbi:MAG: prenyltransferase/squalene oxidase repeat-containing protein [Candidatus Bathyarchaeia archaeon]
MNQMNMRMGQKPVSTILLVALAILIEQPVYATAYPYTPGSQPVSGALSYLRSVQADDGGIGDFASSAWAAMAIAAAGEDPHKWNKTDANPSILDYLKNNRNQLNPSKATDLARFILALNAASENPRDIEGTNYVALLKVLYNNGQLGDESLLNDDFWGLIALVSAGEEDQTMINGIKAFIKANQNGNGGWSYGVGLPSDVDDTAAAIMALTAAGESKGSEAITRGLSYIKSKQMSNGGFESFGSTNVGTDAWAICAIASVGQDPTSEYWTKDGKTPVDDLLTFQNADGSFSWPEPNPMKELATSYAIVALVGRYYPVNGLTVYVRIEGTTDTIWSGYVFVAASSIKDYNHGASHYLPYPTPLGALNRASKMGGFNYLVNDTAWGLYVWSIKNENESGASGWLYRVDYIMPWVGAAYFILGETSPPEPPHREVLWYYGVWTLKPTKLTVDKLEVESGEPFNVEVEWYNDTAGSWLPLQGATVHVNGENYTTEPDGYVSVIKTVASTKSCTVYAEKDGYIRSNRATVRVSPPTGGGAGGNVTVKANITAAVAIVVSPPEIDFGTLGPGDVSDVYMVVITNKGSKRAYITVEVSDDNGLFVKGLRFNGYTHRDFEAYVEGHEGRKAVRVRLWVPEDVGGIGEITGTVTFWAENA